MKTHIELPMFSNKLLCGRKRKQKGYGLRYTWATKHGLVAATCKVCKLMYKKKWKKAFDDFDKQSLRRYSVYG